MVTRAREQIAGDLGQLNAAEREISARRRAFHQRIDAIYLSAPLTDGQRALLDQLERGTTDQRYPPSAAPQDRRTAC